LIKKKEKMKKINQFVVRNSSVLLITRREEAA
jgi:hypothetical protein